MLIEVSSVLIALGSFGATIILGKRSIAVSQQNLKQAEEVAARASADWRQQQWFALFTEANTAHDLLERYRAVVATMGGPQWSDVPAALNAVTLQMRKTNGLAAVFPQCEEIDALSKSTSGYLSQTDYGSKERADDLFNAVEGLRQKALVNPDVLLSGKQL